jgi:predicted metal-dependent phosphoesterase TrpH
MLKVAPASAPAFEPRTPGQGREPIPVRGALHVHSTLSHDGTLTIPELVAWYRKYGYRFIALGEHAQDMDEDKIAILKQQSAEYSTSDFCVIPGLEFACKGGFHIVGLGMTSLLDVVEPAAVIQAIHARKGYAILAHPKRNGWSCPLHVSELIDAAEIWNVGYDGKFLPSPQSLAGFPKLRQANPKLLAVAGQDFHRVAGFYDVGIEMAVSSLSPESILRNLHHGRYTIRARHFSCDSKAAFSMLESARLRVASWQLGKLRQLRTVVSGQ